MKKISLFFSFLNLIFFRSHINFKLKMKIKKEKKKNYLANEQMKK